MHDSLGTRLAAALKWWHQWQGKLVKFMCDNYAIVLGWQGQRSEDSHIMNHCYPFVNTMLILSAYTDWPSWGVLPWVLSL